MMDPQTDRHLERLPRTAPPEGLSDRLAGLIPDPVPAVRPLPGVGASAAILLLMLAIAAVLPGFAAGGKGWKALELAQRSWLAVSLGAAFVWLAVELSRRMIPGARVAMPAAASAMTALAFCSLWAVLATDFQPNPVLFFAACIGFTSGGVLLAAMAVIGFMRRGLVTSPGVAWLVAAASGSAGFVAVQIFCKILETAHILTSHVLPAIVVGGIAGLAARRLLRPAARPGRDSQSPPVLH